ncbi:CHAT domain-containing protein [Gelidibacter maritimus]|uniref:CHAT domain-containing protein n=1 Tax=Gelidibacter maritimus TaxID=2761487 RepID=A0A7W2M5N9_9FLAO|nr:CHAT domain-containing tetratricopeptide repeat protein [Gelidibacter maritimus]MBA6153159.1 CHAT domain-containing protein [Gelidibacter maritimus]
MRHLALFFLPLFWLSFGYSQTIYQKDSLTILADSIHNQGDYDQAISIRKQAIEFQYRAPQDYQTYLNAKYFHTNSAYYEFQSYNYHNSDKGITKKAREQYLDSALQASIKARDLYASVQRPDRMFQYQVQNRVYHQTAYLGNWQHALEQAQLGYEFLEDTLSKTDKIFVDLIYDIGYIHSQLGDYSKAVENYQASLNLYKKIVGENHTDVAQAYNNIAVEYRHLGLRKKELVSLLKAKTIWEDLGGDDNKKHLYSCYGNLFYWYSYYGDFDRAEEYILKKKKLREEEVVKKSGFLRNEEEIYRDQLSNWSDLMHHYARKNDTLKTALYANTILNTIDPNKTLLGFEVKFLTSTLKFYGSIVEKKSNQDALDLVEKAIGLQEKYMTTYYTKSFVFQLYKAELLVSAERYLEAEKVLDALQKLKVDEDIANKFKWTILSARTAQGLYDQNKARLLFDQSFALLNTSDRSIDKLSVSDLLPLISFETIEGFLMMGDFYAQLFQQDGTHENLRKATHRYLLAAKIYNQLYLGQRYNERLFTVYNDINERLLEVGSLQDNNSAVVSEILNTIENNASKLTWSKFVFNTRRQEVDVPKRFINQEENIKSELNFYQDALALAKDGPEEKISLWKDKIYELKSDLVKIQDSIKEENKTYYQLHIKSFDIATLQKSLKERKLILKYIVTNKKLYTFSISKNSIALLPPIDKLKTMSTLKICLDKLKLRKQDYESSFNAMRRLLFDSIDLEPYNRIIIVADGALNYFPFEALLLDKKMPSVGYASSLLLYQEQRKMHSNYETLKVGAFSASNIQNKLPRASDEVNAILDIFEGKSFINASKNEFLEHVEDSNVLHLAMHSNIDELHPEFSSLTFYGENDNQLFISELYHESLDADMAVLSACDTGSGFYENGEGVISLSRAFSYAGVPSTVVSLWKVDDEATAKIMTYFYEHLKLGETKDEALKNAKLDYLNYTEDHLLKHPYYWSGFVLSGNTDALVEARSYWVYFAILPIVVLGFFSKKLVKFFKK